MAVPASHERGSDAPDSYKSGEQGTACHTVRKAGQLATQAMRLESRSTPYVTVDPPLDLKLKIAPSAGRRA